MNKENIKKNTTRILLVLLGVFIVYSLYINFQYRDYAKQSVDRNYKKLHSISIFGTNLADRLEEFVHLSTEKEGNGDNNSEMFNAWRIVNGESKSIYSFFSAISTQHTGEESSAWDLLIYSLYRVDGFVFGMTTHFLEKHSYAVSSEDKEKMVAVIQIYRILKEENEHEPVNVEKILQSIKEPMLVLDDHYQNTLDQFGRE